MALEVKRTRWPGVYWTAEFVTMWRLISSLGLAVVIILPLSARNASAQPGFISGTVRDVEGNPLADAQIVAENSEWQRSLETTTDNNGRFAYVGLQTGQWLFIVQRVGYEPVQGFGNVLGSGMGGSVRFVMETDPLNPPPPSTGVLANLRGIELELALDEADALFDDGNYDDAIEAYSELLEDIPELTSLNLQIGHAYREKTNYDRALAAYRLIPANAAAAEEAQKAIEAVRALAASR